MQVVCKWYASGWYISAIPVSYQYHISTISITYHSHINAITIPVPLSHHSHINAIFLMLKSVFFDGGLFTGY